MIYSWNSDMQGVVKMIGNKIIVIIIAALVVVGATAIVLWPSGERTGEWTPIVGDVEYSKISATPRIIDAIEEMYETVYGELPETVSAPEDKMLEFTSLVQTITGGIEIKSPRTGSPDSTVSFTNDEISSMKVISYGLGFTDSYAEMLGGDVWGTVVAAGNTTWTNYPGNGMDGGTLGSEYGLSAEALLGFLREADGSNTYCLLVWGYITNYDVIAAAISDYSNVKILCVDYYAINSLNYLLSVIDALGQLIGISTEDNTLISEFQDRLYTMTSSIPSDPEIKVYMELTNGNSPGRGTLTQLCFDVLNLENINETSGTNKLSDEIVVSSKPDVIFFDVKDTRTDDQKLRFIV